MLSDPNEVIPAPGAEDGAPEGDGGSGGPWEGGYGGGAWLVAVGGCDVVNGGRGGGLIGACPAMRTSATTLGSPVLVVVVVTIVNLITGLYEGPMKPDP